MSTGRESADAYQAELDRKYAEVYARSTPEQRANVLREDAKAISTTFTITPDMIYDGVGGRSLQNAIAKGIASRVRETSVVMQIGRERAPGKPSYRQRQRQARNRRK